MPESPDDSFVCVRVSDAPLRDALTAALRPEGLTVLAEPPPHGRLVWVLVEEAPGHEAAVREHLQELAAQVGDAPPLVLVAPEEGALGRVEALRAGADELLRWPGEQVVLGPKCAALLRRRQADLDCHPLTGLPGAQALARRLEQARAGKAEVAVVALDLRHFKAYNDRYGFARGNGVIAFVAELLESLSGPGEMVYHIGGDDFVAVVAPSRAAGMAAAAVESFGEGIATFYDAADRAAGSIPGTDREGGQATRFGVMALTVVSTHVESAATVGDVAAEIARLYAQAKG